VPRQTKKQKEAAVEVHKAHLTCLLIHHLNVNKILEDDTVQVRISFVWYVNGYCKVNF